MTRMILAVAAVLAVAGCAGSDPLPDCGVADVDGRYVFNCPAFSLLSGTECRPLGPWELPSVNGERGFYVEQMTFFCPL